MSEIFATSAFGAGTLSTTEQFRQFIQVETVSGGTRVSIYVDGTGPSDMFTALATLQGFTEALTSKSLVMQG